MILACRSAGRKPQAFTLVELMAVVLVITLLAAISLGVSSYVSKRVALSGTRSQIAAIEAALESYKSDWGYYPASTTARNSNTGMKESTNNFILYNALCPTNAASARRKIYLTLAPSQIRTNSTTVLPNIYDPWGSPLVYYCSPTTAYAVMNNLPDPITGTNKGYSVGGQINTATYDLFSYGPDRLTYVPGSLRANGNFSGWYLVGWTTNISARDDIASWNP